MKPKQLILKGLSVLCLLSVAVSAAAQNGILPSNGALPSYNVEKRGAKRAQQYRPVGGAFVCENGTNRFTRALYGGWTDWRVETSDRPVFAIVKKNHHRNLRFVVNGVPLDSTDYCRASYQDGQRSYVLKDKRWGEEPVVELQVVASPDREGAVWWFRSVQFDVPVHFDARLCEIALPRLRRNGDIGADKPGVLEAAPGERGLQRFSWQASGMDYDRTRTYDDTYFVIDSINHVVPLSPVEARERFDAAQRYNKTLASRVSFHTPDPYVNTLGSALSFAADGDWDGQTWLHGCIGWRMPLAGWRAAYVGDILGWNDRQHSHFDAYAKSQVTDVEPVIPHPSQDSALNLARAEKRWGTQMYSNGYICRNPEKNYQMHHSDLNLIYMDELLRHFMFDADTAYMCKMWPVIKRHLEWEKRNYDPDGDHLYDAYCCIWASDALYYSGGAVTHSSAYNYFDNRVAARIAEIIGEDAAPYRKEAEAIAQAMNARLWLGDKGRWAEYQDGMGLRRLHESAAAWSYYTPIDCGVGSAAQHYQAIDDMRRSLPHIQVEDTPYHVVATSNWMPYAWSINNVATAETMHMALACFEAGQSGEGYDLLMGAVMDNMYYGQSPANFGQLSHYDAARGECYRDFGDCIGIASRALVEGLFGVCPNALDGKCVIRPGFPDSWDSVSLKTPYIEYMYTRKDGKERYEVTQHFKQPLAIVVARYDGQQWCYDEGTDAEHQVIELRSTKHGRQEIREEKLSAETDVRGVSSLSPRTLGLDEPDLGKPFRKQDIGKYLNSMVSDIYHQQYLSPRPQTTTLQIPVHGYSEWCHPKDTVHISDSLFRTLVVKDEFTVAGVPFRTPKTGKNIVFTSLWDNYPDSVTLPLAGKASCAYLLMAGSTNHMQSRIDNGLVVATYQDGTADTLRLRNPDNWCPIEQDYYVDGRAFYAASPRPYRVCFATGQVSRDLGSLLRLDDVAMRPVPCGAAQLLKMPLDAKKKLRSLTVRTLSNDVVIGLMGITLQ